MSSVLLFKAIPAVDIVLQRIYSEKRAEAILSGLTRPLCKSLVVSFFDGIRENIKQGHITEVEQLAWDNLLEDLLTYIAQHGASHFRRVINATGVILHTNLGRSLLAKQAAQAVQEVCSSYGNLEFNLESGLRGSRYSHVEPLLCSLTGAEAALVVNNNAAAVFLTLDTLCREREVIVSRGELVEIGGSFRIPEVMEKSGCVLREVGTTNRTHLRDYAAVLNEQTAAVMRVHTSNYRIIGFVGSVSRVELVDLAHSRGLPAIEDLGSGSLCNFSALGIKGLHGEPTVQECVAAGMDIVTLSGDKVLGGPQAGIIVGKKEYVDQIKRNPLNRALRIDKMTLAALEATLRLYTDLPSAMQQIPTLRMMSMTSEELKRAATQLRRIILRKAAERECYIDLVLCKDNSRVGGGSFPECDLPTTLVCIANTHAEQLREVLLQAPVPLVGRIENNRFCLDPRTLQENELAQVASIIVDGALLVRGRAS